MIDVEDTCVRDIPGYGICGKPAEHVVHKILGMSPREHLYKRPNEKEMETAELTADSLHRIAHRSGRKIEDLVAILAMGDVKHENITVQYEVVNDSEPETEEETTDGPEDEEGSGDGLLPTV